MPVTTVRAVVSVTLTVANVGTVYDVHYNVHFL